MGLVDAVEALDPQPRRERWRSLSYCILDAVWSINANYESVVVPLVRGFARTFSDQSPLCLVSEDLPPDPAPLPVVRKRYADPEDLRQLMNSQRTSTRGGTLKAEAALEFVSILADHGISDLAQAMRLLAHDARWQEVNAELRRVPGEGSAGIRRGYLWMLIGADDLIKPDRMVLSWLARQGVVKADATTARELIMQVAVELTQRLGRPVTPWMIDHAIWKAERAARRRRGSSGDQ